MGRGGVILLSTRVRRITVKYSKALLSKLNGNTDNIQSIQGNLSINQRQKDFRIFLNSVFKISLGGGGGKPHRKKYCLSLL